MEVQERRRMARLHLPLPVAFRAWCGVTGDFLEGEAVTRDLSLEGLCLRYPFPNAFRRGQEVDLIITLPLPPVNPSDACQLRARGLVVRLDPPPGRRGMGRVALCFLDGLSFAEPCPPLR